MGNARQWLGPLVLFRFKRIWAAQMFSNLGSWAQISVLQWHMIPYGAVYVSLVNSILVFPVLLLLWPAGILSDTISRRKILVFTQVGMSLCTGILFFFLTIGADRPLFIITILLAVGCFQAIMSPSWYAIVPALVKREMLSQAVALNSTSLNLARIFGPLIGVGLVASGGVASVVFMNMVTYLLAALIFWQNVPESRHPASSILHARNHAPFVWKARQSVIIWRLISFGPISGVIWPLLPIYSAETLKGGAALYSGMLACFGVGAAVTAFAMTKVQELLSVDRTHFISSLFFAATLAVMVITESAWMVGALLIPSGFLAIAALAALNSEMQLTLDESTRGRGMSIYQLVLQGGMAIGGVIWGMVAQVFGLQVAFQCAIVILIVSALSVFYFGLE